MRDRRARLESIVAGSEFVLPVRRLARNGFEAWVEVIAHDYEGLVAKEETSRYEAGPMRRWLKVKQKGWTDQEDRWHRRIREGVWEVINHPWSIRGGKLIHATVQKPGEPNTRRDKDWGAHERFVIRRA